jgi:competence protein ComEC
MAAIIKITDLKKQFNDTWKCVHKPTYSYQRYIHNVSARLKSTLQKKMSKEAYSLFTSLFLGDTVTCKKELEQTKDQFRAWGIMHQLARSGLHLGIFVMVWQALLCVIPLPFLLKELLMLLLSIIYFALSCSSISFMRALYTFILYKICILHKRPHNLIHLLSVVCFAVLLDNPMQLFFLDFQLSFTLTFALAWFNQIASHKKY